MCQMDALKSMGINPELLDEDSVEKLENVTKIINAQGIQDPKEIMKAMSRQGIDIRKLVSKMRGSKTTRGRNEKCPCGSDKKYKKCCFLN